jgi:hypothetical protein
LIAKPNPSVLEPLGFNLIYRERIARVDRGVNHKNQTTEHLKAKKRIEVLIDVSVVSER